MKNVQITDFTDLRVWQLAMELVEQIYNTTNRFPTDERYGLTQQMRSLSAVQYRRGTLQTTR